LSGRTEKRSYEFQQLFEIVQDNLRRRNAAYGGGEILRLRAYDKLQKLVFSGAVKKSGKTYTGNSAALKEKSLKTVCSDSYIQKSGS